MSGFKEHEKNLREFVFEPDVVEALLWLLSIKPSTLSPQDLATKFQEDIQKKPNFPKACSVFHGQQLISAIANAHSGYRMAVTQLQGTWATSGITNHLEVISDNGDLNKYSDNATKIFSRIFNDDQDGKTSPVTIFFPQKPESERNGLVGLKVDWKFYNFDHEWNEIKSLEELVAQKQSFFALKLLLLFKSLGLANLTKSKEDEENILPDILRSLGIESDLHVMEIKSLREAVKGFESKGIIKRDVGDLVKPSQYSVGGDRPFIYTIPKDTVRFINITDDDDEKKIHFPTIHLHQASKAKYKAVHVDAYSEKNPRRNYLSREQLIHFMTIYCSLTNGSAVTLNIPRVPRQGDGREKSGILTPTILVPEYCYEEALRFKRHKVPLGGPVSDPTGATNANGTPAEEDLPPDSTIEAVYGDFSKLKKELIRSYSAGDPEILFSRQPRSK